LNLWNDLPNWKAIAVSLTIAAADRVAAKPGVKITLAFTTSN
jgi:hypothetical protein